MIEKLGRRLRPDLREMGGAEPYFKRDGRLRSSPNRHWTAASGIPKNSTCYRTAACVRQIMLAKRPVSRSRR